RGEQLRSGRGMRRGVTPEASIEQQRRSDCGDRNTCADERSSPGQPHSTSVSNNSLIVRTEDATAINYRWQISSLIFNVYCRTSSLACPRRADRERRNER